MVHSLWTAEGLASSMAPTEALWLIRSELSVTAYARSAARANSAIQPCNQTMDHFTLVHSSAKLLRITDMHDIKNLSKRK